MGFFNLFRRTSPRPSDYYVVFDIETTGLSRARDRIIEIAANRYCNGSLCGSFHTYVNPGFPVATPTTRLTGITNSMLIDAPTILQVKSDFLRFIGSSTLVGHNAVSFDIPFLCSQIGCTIQNPIVDTLHMSREAFPGLPCYKLAFLDQVFHFSSLEHHRAANDVFVTDALYKACKNPQRYHQYYADKDAIAKIEIPSSRNTYFQHVDIHTIFPTNPGSIPDTNLTGKNIVFSGLFAIPRESMMQIAVDAGAILKSSISRQVDYLVIGIPDSRFVNADGMTNKQSRALALNQSGQSHIAIIDEETFLALSSAK